MNDELDGMLAYAAAIRNPSRDDPNWPLPSFDAQDWSEAFCKIAAAQGLTIDQEWMTGWFANALMRGYDEAQMRAATPVVIHSDGTWTGERPLMKGANLGDHY